MKTLRIVLIVILFSSCSKEEDCECITRNTEYGIFNLKACNPELIESFKTMERAERMWIQFEHDYPCK